MEVKIIDWEKLFKKLNCPNINLLIENKELTKLGTIAAIIILTTITNTIFKEMEQYK